MPQDTSFDRLDRDMRAFMASSVLVALAELDLGTILMDNGNSMTAASLAELASCDGRGCAALLDGLAALGYLAKSGTGEKARYSVPEELRDFLHSRSQDTCVPILRHMGSVQRAWTQLGRAVRDGLPQKGEAGILGRREEGVAFIMGMNTLARRLAGPLARKLSEAHALPDEPGARILDVGGASGTYTEAFLEVLPQARAAIFDLPVGIELARKRLAGRLAGDRVEFFEGDFTVDQLPRGFDLAWLSAIIHQMDRADCRKLYASVFEALKPGGVIAVRDFVMDDTGTRPPSGALFGLNMLVNTAAGRVYSLPEISEDMEQAGFENPVLAVDSPDMASVVVARKPVVTAAARS